MALIAGWELVPESDVAARCRSCRPPRRPTSSKTQSKLGRKVSADGVLYGTVETYKERVGSDYAAASPASVAFTLHLVDIKSGRVIWSAHFASCRSR